jgi:guanylate kinase
VLHRIVPHATRAPRKGERNGREYHFVSDAQFDALLVAGEFVFVNDQMAHQRSGTVRAELTKRSIAVIDITAEGARRMRARVTVGEGGEACCVFVHASYEERRRRVEARDPDAAPDEIERMLRDDPVDPDPAHYHDFDLVIENPDGQLDATADRIIALVREFLGVEVAIP